MAATNPCMACGACCATYKVCFSEDEIDNQAGGTIPSSMTVSMGSHRSAMKGTEKRPRRCMALTGTLGVRVSCSIYEHRPRCCREFLASWQENVNNPSCDRARIICGMQAFSPY